MSTDLCFGCFSSPRTEAACPVCGYEHDRDAFPTALPPGDVLTRYVLGRVLGKPGGFGITYLAFDPILNRRLAIKELMPRDLVARRQDGRTLQVHTRSDQPIFAETLQSFLNEARLIAQINHPNVVRVVDFFEANGTAYFAMDYYEGETLSQYLARSGGRLSGHDATSVMLPVLNALEHLHSMPEPILHRDIKPANIYLTSKRTPILLDFGAARVRLGVSRSLSTVLTPGFAPYEQYSTRGNQGPWSDVYACAATMYFLVTGSVPPEASERIEHPAIDDPCRLVPGLPRALGDAILYGMGFKPEDRPRSAREFSELLTSDGSTVPAGRAAAAVVPPADRATELAPAGGTGRASTPPAAAATVISPPSQPAPSSSGPSLAIWAGGSIAALLVVAFAAAQMNRDEGSAPSALAELQEPAATASNTTSSAAQNSSVPLNQETNDPAAAAKLQAGAASAAATAAESAAGTPAALSAAPAATARGSAGGGASQAPAAAFSRGGGSPSSTPPSTGASSSRVNAAPSAPAAVAQSAQAPAAPANGVFVTVYGNDSSDALVVEAAMMRAFQGRQELRAMDQAAMSMARGDDAALAAASRGDFGGLARLGREQGAEYLVVCDLNARAVPSVGGMHTGTAELTVRMYQVSTSRLLGSETFRVGPGGAQAILALGEAEARSRATQGAADQAARAVGNWLARGANP